MQQKAECILEPSEHFKRDVPPVFSLSVPLTQDVSQPINMRAVSSDQTCNKELVRDDTLLVTPTGWGGISTLANDYAIVHRCNWALWAVSKVGVQN